MANSISAVHMFTDRPRTYEQPSGVIVDKFASRISRYQSCKKSLRNLPTIRLVKRTKIWIEEKLSLMVDSDSL